MAELKRILLAEDNPKDVELTLTALDENNLANEVLVVNDGAEALDYLYCRGKFKMRADGDPAVVLLDLKMPRVDGLEVLRRIRSDPRTRMVPVVVLTSSKEDQDLIQAYSIGVNSYVRKPVDFNQFVDAIGQLGLYWLVLNEAPPHS